MTDSIDTNIVLRCILGDVPRQRSLAVSILKSSESLHYLSNQALLECIYVLEITEEMTRREVVDLLTFFRLDSPIRLSTIGHLPSWRFRCIFHIRSCPG